MKNSFLIALLIATVGCATFRHNTVPVADKITSLLEDISALADKSFTGAERQNFAKLVMLPAIRSTKELVACIDTGNCKTLSVHITIIAQSMLSGINVFASKLPNGELKDRLIGKLQTAIDFVTNLYNKHEEETSLSYPEMVIQ